MDHLEGRKDRRLNFHLPVRGQAWDRLLLREKEFEPEVMGWRQEVRRRFVLRCRRFRSRFRIAVGGVFSSTRLPNPVKQNECGLELGPTCPDLGRM